MVVEPKEFYSVKEAAEIIGISRDAAYRMTSKRRLPWTMVNGRKKVPRRALDAWLEEKRDLALAQVAPDEKQEA